LSKQAFEIEPGMIPGCLKDMTGLNPEQRKELGGTCELFENYYKGWKSNWSKGHSRKGAKSAFGLPDDLRPEHDPWVPLQNIRMSISDDLKERR
jgi:hypothetical protein